MNNLAPSRVLPTASRASLPAVIAAAICIQAAQGIFDVSLALRAESAGLSATAFGWTGAAHTLGFVIGAFLAPLALRSLGGYGVLFVACLLASPLAGLGWVSSEALWLPTRLAAGFAFALLFAATDTAVLDTASVANRSRAIGVYVTFERLAMIVMPFAFAARLSAPGTLAYGVGCLWMSLLPGRTLRRSHPRAERLNLKLWSTAQAAWRLAPMPVLCAFAAGALNTSVIILLPRWVHGELGERAVPVVQAAAWLGGLAVQLGVGFLATPRLRMQIGMWLAPAAAVALLGIPLAATIGLPYAVLAGLLLGITAFSQYGLALISLAEIATQRNEPPPTSALVFAWGTGAVVGPATCSAAGLYAHPAALFTTIGILWPAVTVAGWLTQRGTGKGKRAKMRA